jgi:hypothetical protein
MGGFAVAMWGHLRSTRDIDLLIAAANDEQDDLLEKLASHGFRPKRSSALVRVEDGELIQLLYTPPDEFLDIQADLFLARTEFQRSALSRRVTMPAESLSAEVPVVTCEDLILFKLLAGRVIDRVDAAMLLRFNRDSLDMQYLSGWIAKLSLEAAWEEIDREARG